MFPLVEMLTPSLGVNGRREDSDPGVTMEITAYNVIGKKELIHSVLPSPWQHSQARERRQKAQKRERKLA